MTALIALVRKDILIFLSDRRALLLTVLMPILLGTFFGYLFGGSGAKEAGTIDVAVALQDNSTVSEKLFSALRQDSNLRILVLDAAEARKQVAKGKVSAALVIPQGFGDQAVNGLFSSTQAELVLLYDPSKTAALQMLKGVLTQHVMEITMGELTNGGASGKKAIAEQLDTLEAAAQNHPEQKELRTMLHSIAQYQNSNAASANPSTTPSNASNQGGLKLPFTLHEEALHSGPAQYNGYAHSLAGMEVQFLLFMAIDAGISLLLARRLGLWSRLLVAPISLSVVLAARAASSTVIAFVLLCLTFLVGGLTLGVRIEGSMLGFVGVCLCFSLMAAGFGLMIAAFGKTPEAARSTAIFATLLLVMLGGAAVPSFVFPQWLQSATLFIPTRWAVDGLDAMTWRGLGLEVALQSMAVQLGFALLFAGLAVWKFKRSA